MEDLIRANALLTSEDENGRIFLMKRLTTQKSPLMTKVTMIWYFEQLGKLIFRKKPNRQAVSVFGFLLPIFLLHIQPLCLKK